MEPAVQHVVGLLLHSRLLSKEEVKVLYQRWLAEAKPDLREGERFTRWLVAKQYLTDYQAALLARGHTTGFFLGEYKILDFLGNTGLARVYKAVDPQGQRVAMQVLPLSRARDPQLLARFQREAQLALRLQHPHLVRALQSGVDGKHHYLVVEYLDGKTLHEVLAERGPLAPEEAVRLIYQALLGLQHLYEQGLVHRELSAVDLMLVPTSGGSTSAPSPTVKIVLDPTRMASSGRRTLAETQLTPPEARLGTPAYMAPEQAGDAIAADIRADLYSLGCVLHDALTGGPPFPDANLLNQVFCHATEPPRPLRELNPALPDSLQPVLDRLLATDLAQRYATPVQAALALQAWLVAANDRGSLSGADAPPPAPQPGREPLAPRPSSPKAGSGPLPAPDLDPKEVFGVELVAVPTGAGTGLRLSRRDLLMLALGGTSVFMAIFLGWLLAQLVPRKELEPASPVLPEAHPDKDS